MSNAALQGGAGGSGTVTLLAPSTSTNRTITLPDATGTVACTDVAQNFSATQRPSYGTGSITSSYSHTGAYQVVNLTLTTATTVTFNAPSGLVTGAFYTLILTAGDTSARTYAWNSAWKMPSATSPLTTATTTSGAMDIITFVALSSTTAAYVGHSANSQ